MQVPLEISYHNLDRSGWVDDYIRERAEHLDHMSGGLISCRVIVEQVQNQHQTGNPFRVRVEASMPPQKVLIGNKEGIVGDTHVQLRPIIRHAFDAVERQARKTRQILRGETKPRYGSETLSEPRPLAPSVGLVVRIFRDEGYGFIKIPTDNEEYYFHQNAVLHRDFERIELGTQVRFEPSLGDEGPQASTVQIIDKPGKRIGEGRHPASQPPAGWGP